MSAELKRPWELHTCNTIHFLLETHAKYPDLVSANYLKSSLKTPEILAPLAHKHLGRIFWGTTSMAAIAHPSYDTLSRHLSSVKRSQLVAFWTTEINETLAAPNKIKEVVTLKILTDLLNDTVNPLDAKTALKLLTARFVKMIVYSLKSLKLQKHDVLVTFYAEFFDALKQYFDTLANDDAAKVELLQRFLLHPGNLLLEKYLPQNTIHQLINKLGQSGVQSLFDTYKSIFLGHLAKDPKDSAAEWLNVERLHACQMLQYLLAQKSVQSSTASQEWRTEQLTFLMQVGLFHVDAAGDVVSKERASEAIAKPLAASAKSAFFASLQMRLTNLADEKNVLLHLVDTAHAIVSKNKAAKYIQGVWTAASQTAWEQMYAAVQASKKEKKLTMVFQILFLHMGLQLFREAEMAQLAIADLAKCQEKTRQVKKAAKKARKSSLVEGAVEEEEPEWIEVVVDLFLHLLSQNASFLRTIVSNVFPHLCPELTLTAVHQILAMLDMKDGKNPLSVVDDGAAAEEEEEEDDGSDAEENGDKSSDDEDEVDDDDDEEDDDDDDTIQDDEGTVTDQLRNAVSNALVATLPGPEDDDADSVDLNDMDDAEAERLDSALSSAFALLRKSGAHRSKKKSKKERSTTTTVMHFRIRVIDLIEIYLKTKPSLAITIEIMLALYSMIEYCNDADLKSLADKIDRVLKYLLALRHFEDVAEVRCSDVRDLLKSLVEKIESPTKLGAHNQLLSKIFVFLISNASQLPDASTNGDLILQLMQSFATDAITTGNPSIPDTLLQDIFKIRWTGVWQVAETVAAQGLRNGPASLAFRRTQALEQLTLVYKNPGFVKTNVAEFTQSSGRIEKSVQQFIGAAAEPNGRKVSPKGFAALCALLTEIHRTQQTFSFKSQLKWSAVQEQVQLVRTRLTLNALQLQSYAKFCKSQGIVVVKKVDAPKVALNGNHDDADDDGELLTAKVNGNGAVKTTKKRRTEDGEPSDSKAEKRRRREERLRIASIGLEETNGEAAFADE